MDKRDALLNLFTEKCRENNLKITTQRLVICQELLGAHDRPSADNIYTRVRKKFRHISLDTVNRTLLAFVDIGIIKVVEGYGRPKRFDSNTDSHHHFQCIKCHKIIDFYNKTYDKLEIPSNIKDRFIVYNKKVVLEGGCKKCRMKS